MKVGGPEGESTVVGYPMPLAVAVEPMMTSITAGWNSPMILILKTVCFSSNR